MENFEEYLLANVRRDLKALRSHNWLSDEALKQILEVLETGESDGASGQLAVKLPTREVHAPSNGHSPRRHTVGHTSKPSVPGKAPPPRHSNPPSIKAKAKYDNEAMHDDDLPFSAGDIITDFRKVDNDWGHGKCNGQEGIFPLSYVDVIRSSPRVPGRPVAPPGRSSQPAHHGDGGAHTSHTTTVVHEHHVVNDDDGKKGNQWVDRGKNNVFNGATAGFGWAAGHIAAGSLFS